MGRKEINEKFSRVGLFLFLTKLYTPQKPLGEVYVYYRNNRLREVVMSKSWSALYNYCFNSRESGKVSLMPFEDFEKVVHPIEFPCFD